MDIYVKSDYSSIQPSWYRTEAAVAASQHYPKMKSTCAKKIELLIRWWKQCLDPENISSQPSDDLFIKAQLLSLRRSFQSVKTRNQRSWFCPSLTKRVWSTLLSADCLWKSPGPTSCGECQSNQSEQHHGVKVMSVVISDLASAQLKSVSRNNGAFHYALTPLGQPDNSAKNVIKTLYIAPWGLLKVLNKDDFQFQRPRSSPAFFKKSKENDELSPEKLADDLFFWHQSNSSSLVLYWPSSRSFGPWASLMRLTAVARRKVWKSKTSFRMESEPHCS